MLKFISFPNPLDAVMTEKSPRFSRILLKLSGEALAGNKDMGIDADILDQNEFIYCTLGQLGVQVGIVVGGGNLYRGSQLQKDGLVGRGLPPNGHARNCDEWFGIA